MNPASSRSSRPPQAASPVDTTVFQRPPARRIDVGHSRLAYYRFGQGPDLLLIHGWPLHSATFRHILPGLAAHFTCHLFDLPGTGQTPCDANTPISLTDHADTLQRAVDELGLSRYGMVAHDSGGVIARLIAARDPRVAALAFSGSEIAGYRPPRLRLLVAMGQTAAGRAMVMRGMRLKLLRHSPIGVGDCFTDVRYAEGDFHKLFIAPLLQSRQVSENQWRLVHRFDWGLIDRLPQVHAQIRVPTLLVWGEDDAWFPISKLQPTLAQFPAGATLRTIPGGKLFVHEDRADAWLAHALPYLQRRMVGAASGQDLEVERGGAAWQTRSAQPTTRGDDQAWPPRKQQPTAPTAMT